MTSPSLFSRLVEILSSRSEHLEVKTDEPGHYYVDTGKVDEKGKDIFFGMVKEGRKDISFHLMPLYCHPELAEGLSDELAKRLSGKSCFKFKPGDEGLFSELDQLVEKGLEKYRENDWV